MPRLIDANALKALFDERYDSAFMQMHTRDNKEHWNGVCAGVNWGRNTIAEAPTVDAVEVVHGRWELHGNDDDCGCSYFCSNCHKSYDEDYFYVHGQYRHFNYCPNCGAKMDGDGNG